MLLHPAILTLLLCSALLFAVALGVSGAGLTVMVGWDPERADRRQLARERRALLAESGARLMLAVQLLTLFLFVATAQHLHSLFTGAMCAAGTLHASRFGYPTLLVKIAVFLLAGLWLIAHRATKQAVSIGVVRFRYLSLLVVVAALAGENLLQWRFFTGLDPEVLTSCCATIFDSNASGVGAELSAVPVTEGLIALLLAAALTLLLAWRLLARRGSPAGFSLLALTLGGLSLAGLISWVAPAVYELPTHHCPFCLLTAEHGFIGYGLYLSLAVAVLAGGGTGLVGSLRRLDAAGEIEATAERRLCIVSLAGFLVFSALALWPWVNSGLRLEVL